MKRASFVRVLLALAFAAALGPARRARADTPPSAWDIARDPAARDRWALHVRVQRLLHPSDAGPPLLEGPGDADRRLADARLVLEQVDAARSPEVRLRFDLGIVYQQLATVDRDRDWNAKAVAVLEPALDAFPDHPGATEAFDALVSAYARLDRPREELSAWRRYIPRVLDDRRRVTPLMNMGEAEMRLGRLDDALATLREGLRLCESLPNSAGVNGTYALTLWDVAVVLDRSGDPRGAIQTAAKARGWVWMEAAGAGGAFGVRTVTGWDVIRDEVDVFFVPDGERDWYLALGETAAAEAAPDLRDAARLWASAEDHWKSYLNLSAAAGSSDRWLPIARARLERVHERRADAEKRGAKLPPRARNPAEATPL